MVVFKLMLYICNLNVCPKNDRILLQLLVFVRFRQYGMNFPGWVATLVVAVLFLVLWLSCRHDTHCSHTDNTHFVEVDSLLNRVDDADSLAAIAARYHDEDDAVGELLALMYQGRVLRHQSQINEAIIIHSRGMDLATEQCDTLMMIDALNQLAADYQRMGDLSSANGHHYRALSLLEVFSDQDSRQAIKSRVITLNGIANIDINLRHFRSADSILHEALRGESTLGSNKGMAINCANLGSVKRAMNDNDSAWFYYREAMKYNQLDGDRVGIALCHLHFGKLYQDERNISHARKEYLLAYDSLKELGDSYGWLESCISLAEVAILTGEEDESRRYVKEAEAEALRINSKVQLSEAYRLYYELALVEGNPQQALDYLVKSDEMYDAIYGLEKIDEMRCQRIAYQDGVKKGKVMNSLISDIDRLKRMRNLLVIAFVLLLALIAGIIAVSLYSIGMRSRTQRLMRQVEETRSLFFTNVVHQLRTPLTAIMGAADGILAGADKAERGGDFPPEDRENVEIIKRQGVNLLTLVDRILEVGGVRSSLKDPDWQTGDVMTFLHMIIESYRETCVERHIELSYAPRDLDVEISTVPYYLNTIMGSLIENAISYSHEFGKITITSRVDNGWLIIRVADNGMGIDKADLLHVFEPFYRGAAAEQIVDGVGIGLTVTRDMAMAMGGTVAVDSMKDHGTVFTVKLPCRPEMGVRRRLENVVAPVRKILWRPHDEETPSTSVAVSSGSKPVVLIVEDHEDVAHLLGRFLGENYEVQYALDGEQGLTTLRKLIPDLIITDVKMPVMDGYELCRKVRASRRLCHIPIIMLSARNSQLDRMCGIEAGADVYLVKPFIPEEIRIWIKHLLESRKQLRDVYSEPCNVDLPPTLPVGSHDDQHFLELFGQEMNKQLAETGKVDVDQLALAFKMGESQLRSKIQTMTGKNLQAYVMQLRMEKAWQLLRNNKNMLVGDIANQCGFTDVAYFSRVFRQHYGMTPTQARTQ